MVSRVMEGQQLRQALIQFAASQPIMPETYSSPTRQIRVFARLAQTASLRRSQEMAHSRFPGTGGQRLVPVYPLHGRLFWTEQEISTLALGIASAKSMPLERLPQSRVAVS